MIPYLISTISLYSLDIPLRVSLKQICHYNSDTESNDIIDENDNEPTVSSSYEEEELGSDTETPENSNENDNSFCFTLRFVPLIL